MLNLCGRNRVFPECWPFPSWRVYRRRNLLSTHAPLATRATHLCCCHRSISQHEHACTYLTPVRHCCSWSPSFLFSPPFSSLAAFYPRDVLLYVLSAAFLFAYTETNKACHLAKTDTTT